MRLRLCVLVGATAIALSGCGGGGGSPSVPPPPSSHSGQPPTTLPAQYAITDLGANAQPRHVNDSGVVVGSLQSNAFVWKNGVVTQFAPLSGYSSAIAYWISNPGEIVGTSYSGGNNMQRATLFESGAAMDLGAPANYPDSAAYSVNDGGMIVGAAAGSGAMGIRFSAVTIFDGHGNASMPSGQFGGEAYAVNNAGELAGAAIYSFPGYNSYVFKAPPFAKIGAPGVTSAPTGINNKGDIVGTYYNGPAAGGGGDGWIVYANGTVVQLYGPGSSTGTPSIQALGVNDNDWIVGSFQSPSFSGSHAFVYLSSTVDLNTLLPSNSGWTLESATSVNLWGQIVGTGMLNGVSHGFLLTPSP